MAVYACDKPKPTHQEIADRAYQIYLLEGKPQDKAAEHWRRAEQELAASPTNGQGGTTAIQACVTSRKAVATRG